MKAVSSYRLAGLCIIALVLLASSFIATRHQSLIFHSNEQVPPHPPSSFSDAAPWNVVAAWAPRAPNRCPYSSCQFSRNHHEADISQVGNAFNQSFTTQCPGYFRFIHDDLLPWKTSKISKHLLDSARTQSKYEASFTVVIKAGRLYVDPIGNCYQTRAILSIWGLLQLLKFYPGLVPDVELVFGCGDKPAILRKNHTHSLPPPVFRYCTTLDHFDIPFPDWSFWGWPEVNIQPWDLVLQTIQKGSSKRTWKRRLPKAFWKGNTVMGDGTRAELMKCNGDSAEIRGQNWDQEVHAGFQHSKLSEQCKHRYKVYVEGIGWSVSLKYILACDSPMLLVKPKYLEFFTRGLIARKHFWPIPPSNLCPAIKSAVEWGNEHIIEAEEVGKEGSRFVREEVSMTHVYEYMLHVLHEYSRLLDFTPEPGGHLRELCPDTFLCVTPPLERPFYEDSMVHEGSQTLPCYFDTSPLNSSP